MTEEEDMAQIYKSAPDAGAAVCDETRDETREGVRRPIPTLLLIDDEEQVRIFFRVALEEAGYRVLTAENGKHGLHLLKHQVVDLTLVDILMPDMDGLELIRLFHKMRPATKIIAISGASGEWDYLGTAKQLGANDTLRKPFSLQELLEAVAVQLNPPFDPRSIGAVRLAGIRLF
jgi:two-component system response regulator (stage 0 sporulation protein F)